MFRVSAGALPLFAIVLLATACSDQERNGPSSSATPLGPAAAAPPTTPPPAGSSFKNCRGGRNVHWWRAHVDRVVAGDLEALAQLNLLNADRSPFDPSDTATLEEWLRQGSRADDLFYALSTQLAVAVLNVRHGFVSESGTFVLVDQANRELARENPSLGFMDTLLYEFTRCQ